MFWILLVVVGFFWVAFVWQWIKLGKEIAGFDKQAFFFLSVVLVLIWWFGGWGPKACGSALGEFEKARIEAREGKSEEKSEEKRED